ncbi:hypothetical protein L9F63_014838, partial [Diploptera punctata]
KDLPSDRILPWMSSYRVKETTFADHFPKMMCTKHLLLAMTQDSKEHIKELGHRRILKTRQIDARRAPPKINFKAQEYSGMINWMDCELSSPPLLAEISDDEIKSHIDKLYFYFFIK